MVSLVVAHSLGLDWQLDCWIKFCTMKEISGETNVQNALCDISVTQQRFVVFYYI